MSERCRCTAAAQTRRRQKGKENALPCTVSKPQPRGSSTQTYTHHLNVCFDRRPRWDHIWTTPNLWAFPFAFCWPSARCLKGERSHAWGHADHHVPFMIAIIYTHKKWSATSAQWQPSRMVGEMQRQVCPFTPGRIGEVRVTEKMGCITPSQIKHSTQ